MNQLTTIQRGDAVALPKLSRDLELHMMPPSGPEARQSPPTSEMVEEARTAIMSTWPMREPVTREAIREWLTPINLAVRNPQPAKEFGVRVNAIAMACDDLPGWVFNGETLREGLKAWAFWPAAADVRTLLDAHAAPILARLDALQRVAQYEAAPAPPPAPAKPEMTPEQRAEAARQMRETIAKARPVDPPPRPVRAAPVLSRATLNELYRQQGLSAPKVPA